MDNFKLQTPIAFIIFNRPDTTRLVFEAIRKAKPSKLLVIADGPRPSHADDQDRCNATRAIIDSVDWECEVLRNYSSVNLGCGKRPATGISWVFEQVEEAIILEDDCVPHLDFFAFCQEMLITFRQDERIGAISGTNINGHWKDDCQSYHYSYLGGNWGWAGWARAWRDFDYDLTAWENDEIKARIRDVLADSDLFRYYAKSFDATLAGQNVTWWDYQWMFTRLIQSRMTIVPSKNLISNVGFRPDATHTKSPNSVYAEIPAYQLDFPLKHNNIVAVDRDYDRLFYKKESLLNKIFLKLRGK